MKSIKTIADLASAEAVDIEIALEKVKVIDDLTRYLDWLYCQDGYEIRVEAKLGNHRRSLGLHPSSFSKPDQCRLRLYYEATGLVDKIDNISAEKRLVFNVGTVIHEMMQAYILDMYEDRAKTESQISIPELLVKGSGDVVYEDDDVRFYIEMKSIKEGKPGASYGYEAVTRSPMPDHVRQLRTYMKADDCPFGLVLYFNKNDSRLCEHVIQWDEAEWQKILDDITPVVEAVNTETAPEGVTGYHCRECPFEHGCEATKKGRGHGQEGRRLRRRAIR